MKDCTDELYGAILTLLDGQLTYKSKVWSVYENMPRNHSPFYVWLKEIYVTYEYVQDCYLSNCSIAIEVGFVGAHQRGNKTAISSITSQIMQAVIDVDVSMSSFTTTIRPYLESIIPIPVESVTGGKVRNRSELNLIMQCEQD